MSIQAPELPAAWKPFAKLEPSPAAPLVTQDQLELVRKTIAAGATADELKLYLHDCARQGVHPLDKLIHFTKRGGKYTPITSIDFMRTRAADTNEYAGSDDAKFVSDGNGAAPAVVSSATVTVWRFVQGQRCSFTATARWDEYCPAQGQDHMWRKMPHTMLAKCAEALALRKGFPRQLAGLYAREEMDQADEPKGYVVKAPTGQAIGGTGEQPSNRTAQSEPEAASDRELPRHDAPDGAVYITKVESGAGKAKGFLRHSGQAGGGMAVEGIAIYDERLVTLASECCQERTPVMLVLKTAASGKPYVKAITRDVPVPTDAELDAEMAQRERAEHAGDVF